VRWKTGFYRIAVGAGVPIVPVALDYRMRVVAIMAPVSPDQDETAGVARIRSLFRREMAKYPERFAEEAAAPGAENETRREGSSTAY
jgi:1-acyl-sn-glycerol-3-phosphate acyltransferase